MQAPAAERQPCPVPAVPVADAVPVASVGSDVPVAGSGGVPVSDALPVPGIGSVAVSVPVSVPDGV